MKIEYGCQPNCSETVIRLKQEDYNKIPPDLMSKWWSMSEPSEGYSSMRPLKDTQCVYFYQMGGNELIDWLEEKKLGYDIEAPFAPERKEWEPLEPTEDEKEIASESDGGGGDFYRRLPYDN